MKVAILPVVYYEPDWYKTCASIANLDLSAPVYLTDRQGVGSLVKAFNSGFNTHHLEDYDFVWFLTNVVFHPAMLRELLTQMMLNPTCAAITPAFQSDHAFCRPEANYLLTKEVPFVEFTAPLVRASVFAACQLDEHMPYAGHDIDWGYRVRHAGHTLGVYHGATLQHTYIHQAARHTTNPFTKERWKRRRMAEETTKNFLHDKYGPDWKTLLQCNY